MLACELRSMSALMHSSSTASVLLPSRDTLAWRRTLRRRAGRFGVCSVDSPIHIPLPACSADASIHPCLPLRPSHPAHVFVPYRTSRHVPSCRSRRVQGGSTRAAACTAASERSTAPLSSSERRRQRIVSVLRMPRTPVIAPYAQQTRRVGSAHYTRRALRRGRRSVRVAASRQART